MKLHIWFIAVVTLTLTSTSLAAPLAGPILNPANGHSYSLLESNSWTASEAEAVGLGGHLATVRSQAENDWIFDTFSPYLSAVNRAAMWIGLNDSSVEGAFGWVSGEAVAYTNWGGVEPNNDSFWGGEDYGLIVVDGFNLLNPRKWNDTNNTGSSLNVYGVAEVVPEPAIGVVSSSIAMLFTRIRRRRVAEAQIKRPTRM